jgi:heme oxygenase (biliverdin-IX-beta and delta-forming)
MTEALQETPAAPAYDALAEAKVLLRRIRAAALATLAPPSGEPFATLVNVATEPDGSPILLMSQLAAHTRHLAADPRLSLLLAQSGAGDPLAHPRLTLTGKAEKVTEPERRAALKARFLSRHPKSALYADFGDFAFFHVEIAQAHLNGGFGKTGRFNAATLLTDVSGAEALLAGEADALAHMNADHKDALSLYATVLAGAPQGAWVATGIDPEGMDLADGDLTARLTFPQRVSDGEGLRKVLVELAKAARG